MVDPRTIHEGQILRVSFRGKKYTARVVIDENDILRFRYRGKIYSTLSAVASKIVGKGYMVNGWRFFS